MTSKIDLGLAPVPASSPLRPVARVRDSDTTAAREPAGGDDSVALTGEAQTLQRLERQVRADSGVDEAKVAEVRRMLSQGAYPADPQTIAHRLMHTEWSLR